MADFSSLNGYNVKDAKARNDIEAMKTSVVDNLSSESTNLPLSAKQGNVLNENKADKLVVNQLSNPNLLINGDFQVWQEGTSFKFTADGKVHYCAEMWWISSYAGTVTKVANGLKMSASDYIAQSLETPLKTGKNYTMSYCKNDNEIVVKHIVGGTYVTNCGIENIKYLLDGGGYESVKIYLNGGDVLNWVKLEQGTVATPFVPRTYQEEWLVCQRYYQVSRFGALPFIYIYSSELKYRTIIPFITRMRTSPTVQYVVGHSFANGTGITSYKYEAMQWYDHSITVDLYFSPGISTNTCNSMIIEGAFDARIYPSF